MDNTRGGGILSKARGFLSSETPFFRDRAVLSLWYRKDLFHMRSGNRQVLLTALREKSKGRGRESSMIVSLNFL